MTIQCFSCGVGVDFGEAHRCDPLPQTRDCTHGRKRGKCSDCDVVELEQRAEKAEALVKELDLAVRVALAFTRPGVEGALHLLDVERVETAADLTNYLRSVLAKVGK